MDDPDHFAAELRALDVPADRVRHPAVFGRIGRSRPLTAHELARVRAMTTRPVKVALPGPYLLTRTMWLECVSDRAYPDRERPWPKASSASSARGPGPPGRRGPTLVQFDEPVLTEVVFGPTGGRSFMCGALGETCPDERIGAFAGRLITAVVSDLPRDRVALHVCRGNWSRDEGVALTDHTPRSSRCCERCRSARSFGNGDSRGRQLSALRDLPAECRLGLGS